ncbi:MAG: glycosyltransferase family 2 protein [Candidatus Peribacteraceae bacterium]|nr:glycosyltransferase family 2 protein [Candidatus Peribacteraceae bacterium]
MQTLAIIIPAYNEQDRLPKTLASIKDAWDSDAMSGLTLSQVIIADDGSMDGTAAAADSWKGRLPIITAVLAKNTGKGAAVRAGMALVNADLALMYDADGAAPITEVSKLLVAIEGGADIAIGSRVMNHERSLVTMRWHRRFIGRVYHFLGSALVPGIQDTACGCKLFRSDVAKKLFSLQRIDRFAFDVEVLALALRHGYTVAEIPLAWTAVPESKVRIVRDGLEMFWCLIVLYSSSFRRSSPERHNERK